MDNSGEKSLTEAWQRVMKGSQSSWVLFRNGTCVVLSQPGRDVRRQAVELMRQWGRVQVGTPAGDFNVFKLPEVPGWLVTSHSEAISTYVDPGEIEDPHPSDVFIGLTGRSKRDQDAQELRVIYVHIPRS